MLTLCSIIIIANLGGKQIKSIQIFLAIFLAFFATFLIWYTNGCQEGLLASLVVFSAPLPLVWENRIKMDYGSWTLNADAENTISAGGSSTSQPATGSASNTTLTPEQIQQGIASIPQGMAELMGNPSELSKQMKNLTILGKLNISESLKAELMEQAQKESPLIPAIPSNIPDAAVDYWHYKIVNSKAKIELKLMDLVKEKLSMSPQFKAQFDERKALYTGLKHTSYYHMKYRFPSLNHSTRRFITRNMDQYVDGNSLSDNE